MSTSSAATVKWNDATVTQAGFRLQASMLQGGGFEFTRVIGADENGIAKVTLSLQPGTVAEAKITVPVLLSNAGLSEGFTMKQLQFYAKGTGAAPADEILYAVAQDSVGDYIPSAAESPGFTIDWSYTFQFGNADSVTVNLDPAGLVSFDIVGAANGVAGLDENGAVPVAQGGTGATTAQGAMLALGALFAIAAAAVYNPSGTYAVGDYCTNDGNLYKCNTPIPDGETWNAAHWTETSVAAELAEVRASLSNLESVLTTPPQEFDLPLAEGVTSVGAGYKNTYSKDQFGIVRVWFSVRFENIPPIDAPVFTLPEGFRPDSVCYNAAILSMNAHYPALLSISASGIATVSHGNIEQAGAINLHGYIEFPAAS